MHVVDLIGFLHVCNNFVFRISQSISTAQRAVLKNFSHYYMQNLKKVMVSYDSTSYLNLDLDFSWYIWPEQEVVQLIKLMDTVFTWRKNEEKIC